MDHEEYRTRTNALTDAPLTLRDHFAAAALTGLLASQPHAQEMAEISPEHFNAIYAKDAYALANAMLVARTMTKETP